MDCLFSLVGHQRAPCAESRSLKQVQEESARMASVISALREEHASLTQSQIEYRRSFLNDYEDARVRTMESISRLEDHQNRLAEKQSDYASGLKRVQDLLDIRLV